MDLINNKEELSKEKMGGDVISSEIVDELETANTGRKVLKYAAKIEQVQAANNSHCLDAGYVEKNLPAFRWTFADIKHPNNFLPRALLLDDNNPSRDQTVNSCHGWSLSFFETENAAIARLIKIIGDKEYLYKKLGTHVAEGLISKEDGKCGDFNSHRHFEHFEYSNTDFSNKFTVLKKVSK